MKVTSYLKVIICVCTILCGCDEHKSSLNLKKSQKSDTDYLSPYKEWYFSFIIPRSLPALPTYLELLDTDGIAYHFETLDWPQGESIGKWNEHNGYGTPAFNKAKNPPQYILFCWDSVIDKKTYETKITFYSDTWLKMITPEPEWSDKSKNYYHRYMIISLAPEGKARVWLEDHGKQDLLLTTPKISTVSGKDLTFCKDKTKHPNGYKYYGETSEFIKNKKYPYGVW